VTIDLLNWGLRTGVVMSGLIGLVLLLRRPFARYFGAEATFLLWSLPLIRLCLPDMYMPVKTQGVIFPYDKFPMWGEGEIATSLETVPAPKIVETAVETQFTLTPDMIISTVVFIWLSGAVLWLGFHWIQHIRYGRLLRHVSTDCPDSLKANIARAATLLKLKNIPTLKVAPKTIGPLVSGIVNPIVILPKDFETSYSSDAQILSLTHEFAHIKRRDLWSAFAALLFRALHWYNPLVHYAARKFRIDLEAACDAYTLSKFAANDDVAHDYALTLLLAEQGPASTMNSKMPALSLALADNFDGGSS